MTALVTIKCPCRAECLEYLVVRSFAGLYSLTPREAQVADAVIQGRSYAANALALGMAVNTLQVHLARVYNKVGLGTRLELFLLAYDRALRAVA